MTFLLFFFLIDTPHNLMCTLDLQYISIQPVTFQVPNCHISPASGYHIGQRYFKRFLERIDKV